MHTMPSPSHGRAQTIAALARGALSNLAGREASTASTSSSKHDFETVVVTLNNFGTASSARGPGGSSARY